MILATSLNSGVTLAVVFSFIAMLAQLGTIYALIHTRHKEATDKEVSEARLIGDVKAQIGEIKTSFDFLFRSVDATNKTVEKSDRKLDNALSMLSEQGARLNDLERRVERLEGKENG